MYEKYQRRWWPKRRSAAESYRREIKAWRAKNLSAIATYQKAICEKASYRSEKASPEKKRSSCSILRKYRPVNQPSTRSESWRLNVSSLISE